MKDKKVLIFGTGISGVAAAKLLMDSAKDIIMFEGSESADVEAIRLKLGDKFHGEIIVGNLPSEIIDTLDMVVLSPGVPTDLKLVQQIKEKNIPVIGEVELAYYFSKGKIIGLTGTNGKTTTTTLVGQIMQAHFDSVFVVGNIGIPYTNMVTQTCDKSVTVAELSSFQLETIDTFHANVSAILNITPDHLNRHHTMENYIEAKKNITKNQQSTDTCVLNYEDQALRHMGEDLDSKVIYFSSKTILSNGVYLQDDIIKYNLDNNIVEVCHINELNIFGSHSYENVMAAIAIAYAMLVPLATIQKVIKAFVAVEHRIEYVATKNGVKYYNDSKGTNPDASMKAIEAMQSKTILIAGGFDKNSDFTEWIQSFQGKIKCLVLLGQTKHMIKETALKLGFSHIVLVESMEEAVNISSKYGTEGENVLLSPACASWGMFKDYEERGHVFKDLVHKL